MATAPKCKGCGKSHFGRCDNAPADRMSGGVRIVPPGPGRSVLADLRSKIASIEAGQPADKASPAPAVDLSPIIARIEALESAIAGLHAQLDALKASPAPEPAPADKPATKARSSRAEYMAKYRARKASPPPS